jgi:hypothetical protein
LLFTSLKRAHHTWTHQLTVDLERGSIILIFFSTQLSMPDWYSKIIWSIIAAATHKVICSWKGGLADMLPQEIFSSATFRNMERVLRCIIRGNCAVML